MQCGVCTHSFAGSRLVSCHVPETVCCRSRDLPACSPGAFLRGALPWRYPLSSSSLNKSNRAIPGSHKNNEHIAERSTRLPM